MDIEHIVIGISFLCLAAACLVFYIRSGKLLKKRKRELERIGKRLEETKPPT
jgi:uncharacterized protein YoxC